MKVAHFSHQENYAYHIGSLTVHTQKSIAEKEGLGNATSAICMHQHYFGLTFINLAFCC